MICTSCWDWVCQWIGSHWIMAWPGPGRLTRNLTQSEFEHLCISTLIQFDGGGLQLTEAVLVGEKTTKLGYLFMHLLLKGALAFETQVVTEATRSQYSIVFCETYSRLKLLDQSWRSYLSITKFRFGTQWCLNLRLSFMFNMFWLIISRSKVICKIQIPINKYQHIRN